MFDCRIYWKQEMGVNDWKCMDINFESFIHTVRFQLKVIFVFCDFLTLPINSFLKIKDELMC